MCEAQQCLDCGADIASDALEGFCRECLLRAALDDSVEFSNTQIHCPHCGQPVESCDVTTLRNVVCRACNERFSLVDDDDAASHRSISRFELLEVVGSGSFGTVWKSRDRELDRTVAVKIPHKGQVSPLEAEQFLREARAAAQLNHPNIVGVHEVGRENGQVYIVSDYIDGQNLSDWLRPTKVTPTEAAELCVKLAEALHHAHEAGVIHRDLKPSNILIDAEGEPHIMDFGLAKREAGEVSMTMEGKVLGTPAYMSPEQAQGESHKADRRSDVYSLGVILFELLTGEKPFRGSLRMLLHQVIHQDAPPPHTLNSGVPRDLETICLKCLEKAPQKRYASAAELAAELRRFLRGEPIQARPITMLTRIGRWCERNPVVAGLGIMVGVLLLVLAIGGPLVAISQAHLAAKEAEAKQQAHDEKQRAGLIYRTAERHYRRAIVLLEELVDEIPEDEDSAYPARLAAVCNDLAWILATSGDPELGDPKHALELASLAVHRDPEKMEYWLTLGAAEYRSGHWQESIEALDRCATLDAKQHAGARWLFQAMARWQLGRRDEALQSYDKAVEWVAEHTAEDEGVLQDLREEAAALLGAPRDDQDHEAPPAPAA